MFDDEIETSELKMCVLIGLKCPFGDYDLGLVLDNIAETSKQKMIYLIANLC